MTRNQILYLDDRSAEDIPQPECDAVCVRRYGMNYADLLRWELEQQKEDAK